MFSSVHNFSATRSFALRARGFSSILEWDLRYIENIRFRTDLGLVFKTFAKVFGRGEERETQQERKLTYDYGYELLQNGYISEELYKEKQQHAKTILEKTGV